MVEIWLVEGDNYSGWDCSYFKQYIMMINDESPSILHIIRDIYESIVSQIS